MYTPSATELLDVWEQGQAQRPVERALALLAFALPGQPPDALARLNIGRRDDYLLQLREQIFGPRFISVAACPACGDRLELDFAAADVRTAPPDTQADTLALNTDGYQIRFRLPNSLDLAVLASTPGIDDPQRALLQRCIDDARRGGDKIQPEGLPERVINTVIEHMATADPQADVQLALTCPACEQHWNELFDIVSFLWTEIDAWAARTLRDIHTLALHYGWHEADILAMSAWRRQIYLRLLGG
jgi:hypothetical protein